MLEGNIVNYFNTKKPQLFKSTYVTNLVIGISRFFNRFGFITAKIGSYSVLIERFQKIQRSMKS